MSQLKNAVACGITHSVITESMSAETKKKLKKAGIAAGALAALAALGGGAQMYRNRNSKTGTVQGVKRTISAAEDKGAVAALKGAMPGVKSKAKQVGNQITGGLFNKKG